jgi:hypothetical protein
VASDDDGGSLTSGRGCGGASPTAVLLALLNVSLLARSTAEGNRGRGLTVTWVGRVEGGGAVAEDKGNGIIEIAAAGLERLALGGYASLSRRGGAVGGAVCAASRLVECFDSRSAETARKGSEAETSRGSPSTASTTRRKSRRVARHSFSFVESDAQSPASLGTPRAVQNIVFLHKLVSLVNICIVRSLRENRILMAVIVLAEIVAVVDRGFVLISMSARGSFAMRVHTNLSSYMTT